MRLPLALLVLLALLGWGLGTASVQAAPVITLQPVSQTVLETNSAQFTIAATGTGALTYQWRRGTTNLAGATGTTLTLNNLAVSQTATNYACVVGDVSGSVTSAPVALIVLADFDRDGMADFWEVAYGFNTNNAADALLDSDGDGIINRLEFQLGRIPTNSTSRQQVFLVSYGKGSATISVSFAFPLGLRQLQVTNYSLIRIVGANRVPIPILFALRSSDRSVRLILSQPLQSGLLLSDGDYEFGTEDEFGKFTIPVEANAVVTTGVTPCVCPPPATNGCPGIPVCLDAQFCVGNDTSSVTIDVLEGTTVVKTATANKTGSEGYYVYANVKVIYETSGTRTITIKQTGTGQPGCPATSVQIGAETTATQLSSQSKCAGETASFSTTASGTGTLGYMWFKDDVMINGADADTYTINPVAAGDAGRYCVKVTGACGSVTNCATLTVSTPSPTIICPPDVTVECPNSTEPPATGMATANISCGPTPTVTHMDIMRTEVTAGSPAGWQVSATLTAMAQFVDDPTVPPLPTGSLHLTVGANGVAVGQARNTAYHNTLLNALTELDYWAYRAASPDANNNVMIVLNIDTDGNGSADDVLVFEPRYQTPATGNPALPNQGAILIGIWQKWNALKGGWYSVIHPLIASEGVPVPGNAGVQALSVYIAAFPNARIVNPGVGGGVHLVAGDGLGDWQSFDGNADAFTIGVNGVSTTFDFELTPGLDCLVTKVKSFIVRTWTATSSSGRECSCTQIITVKDTTAPSIACANFSVPCGVAPPPDAGNIMATDSCDPNPIITFVSDVTSPSGQTVTRTYRATDACGNTNDCKQIITLLNNNVPPQITLCPVSSTYYLCPGQSSVELTLTAEAVDSDRETLRSAWYLNGNIFPGGFLTEPENEEHDTKIHDSRPVTLMPGTHLLKFCVYDRCFDAPVCCELTITVVLDTTPPVIDYCPISVLACLCPTAPSCGILQDVTSQVVAHDNSGQFTVKQIPEAGTKVCLGAVVTIEVRDNCNNTTTCQVRIAFDKCCTEPPPNMVLWLPFDEKVGNVANNAKSGNNGRLYEGAILANAVFGPKHVQGEYVENCLAFDGFIDVVRVPSYAGINVGTHDFSVDAWVYAETNLYGTIVQKFDSTTSQGWSLELGGGMLILYMGTPAHLVSSVVGPAVSLGQWHHVAASLCRTNSSVGFLWVDGQIQYFDTAPFAGSLSVSKDLAVGGPSTSLGSGASFRGKIDEVELFCRCLTTNEMRALWFAGAKGKCKVDCHIAWDTMVCNNLPVTVNAQIQNHSGVARTCTYSFSGLPKDGGNCTAPPPIKYAPSSGTVTIPANGIINIPVDVTPSSFMLPGQIACFRMTVKCGSERFVCDASLQACSNFIATATNDCVPVVVGTTNGTGFNLTNISMAAVNLSYDFRVFGVGMVESPDVVVIGQNSGTISLTPGSWTNVTYRWYLRDCAERLRFYDIVLFVNGRAAASTAVLPFEPATETNNIARLSQTVSWVTNGGNISVTVTVNNAGPDFARDVFLTNHIPAGLSGPGCGIPVAEPDGRSRAVCAVGVIAPGASVSRTFQGTFAGNALLFSAEVAGSTPTDDLAGNVVEDWSPGRPVILAQPASVTVQVGDIAEFVVGAGGRDLSYQWLTNGVPVDTGVPIDPRDPRFAFPYKPVYASNLTFTVRVSNPSGSVLSAPATLTFAPNVPSTGQGGLLGGFAANSLGAADDDSSARVPLCFNLCYCGVTYSNVWINNNGNVTLDGPLGAYTPGTPLVALGRVIFAPFWADVDTRHPRSGQVKWGCNCVYVPGVGWRQAFGVTWRNVGFYASQYAPPGNSFQMLFIDRSDRGTGDFDLQYRYANLRWDIGQASGGDANGLCASPTAPAARAGFAGGTNCSEELPGSGVCGALLDGNPATGLINYKRNSAANGVYTWPFLNCRPCPVNLPGIVAWWRAENNAVDSIGNHHGTLQNGAGFAAGKVAQAFRFDGVDDHVRVPNSADLNLGNNFTIELWLNQVAAVPSYGYNLVAKQTAGIGDGWTFDTFDSFQTGRRLRLCAQGCYSANTVYSLNAWHHAAVTYSQGTLTFYLDGVPDGSYTGVAAPPANNLDALIGASDDGSGGIWTHKLFNGLLDEVSLYNRALCPAEIQAIYNAGAAGKCGLGPIDCGGLIAVTRTNVCPRGDDSSWGPIPLCFSNLCFCGVQYSSFYINNNGSITFGGPLSTYTPGPITGAGRPIIAPFWADVDTRPASGGKVSEGCTQVYIDGQPRPAHVITWENVGYYGQHTDKLNTFQLVLIDRSDRAPGDFDCQFRYAKIQWETGDASGGVNGLGGSSARAGWGDGSRCLFELFGSAVNGAFLDSNPSTGLIYNTVNNGVPGIYTYSVTNCMPRTPLTNRPPVAIAGRPQSICVDANCCALVSLNGSASSDPDGDTLTYTWKEGATTLATGPTPTVQFCPPTALGAHTIQLTVNDGHGHTASSSVVITLRDCTPPSILCPANITVTACLTNIPNLCPLLNPTDNCTPAAQITCSQSPPAGTPVGPGVYTIVLTACDAAGNCNQCNVSYTVLPGQTSAIQVGLFNTGVDNTGARLPNENPFDGHYRMTASAYPAAPAPKNGEVLFPVFAPWLLDGVSSQSRWVGPLTNMWSIPPASIPNGAFTYQLKFNLDGLDLGSAQIGGRWAADDVGTIWIQNAAGSFVEVPGSTTGAGAWGPFTIPSAMLKPSMNTLEFRTLNTGLGPTGLRVEFTNVVLTCTNPCVPPYIVTQPRDFTTGTPGQGTFSVVAGGTGPLSYQWFCNGVALTNGPNVSGAQSATLTLQNATANALYTVRVTNPCGQVLSSGARIIFRPRLQGPVYTPLAFTFQLPTVAGTTYRVERADTLGPDAVWKVLTTVTGTGALVPVTDPEPASATRFYRAVEVPAQP